MLRSEFVPAAVPESRDLLIVLHGLGDSHAGWRWLPAELALPWLNYLLVDAPQEYYGGFSWFDIEIPTRPGDSLRVDPAGVDRSRTQLLELLKAQRAQGYLPERTAVLGFSQGCLMTLEAGLRSPDRLAALVGISGWVHEPKQLIASASVEARKTPVLVTHGTDDELIPLAWAEPGVRQLQAAGLDVAWQEFEKGHTVAGRAEVGFIRRFLEGAFNRPATRRVGTGPAEG